MTTETKTEAPPSMPKSKRTTKVGAGQKRRRVRVGVAEKAAALRERAEKMLAEDSARRHQRYRECLARASQLVRKAASWAVDSNVSTDTLRVADELLSMSKADWAPTEVLGVTIKMDT